MRSLLVKLVGAFALVILIGSGFNAWLVNHFTQDEFGRYVTENGRVMVESYLPILTEYYRSEGNWDGVANVMESPWMSRMHAGRVMPGMNGMMGGQGPNNNPWSMMGVRLLLADENGKIAYDTQGIARGESLSAAELAAGKEIRVDQKLVGTLLSVSTEAFLAGAAAEFVIGVRQSIWIAGLVATIVAIIFGIILFKQIISPVTDLTRAAEQIADGHIDQRIPVKSQDEIGQLSIAFNHMAEVLAQQQQLRRNLIADVAHELRTPISVLQGNLEAMLDGVLSRSPEEITVLHDESVLLGRLVDDLSLLSLADSGQLELRRSEADIVNIINKVIESFHEKIQSKEIMLYTKFSPAIPLIFVDPDRITQVIRNLVSNAIRHTASGGTVKIDVDLLQSNDRKTDEILICVGDDGEGISSEDLPFVFDRFYRVDKSRSRSSGGTGIGLAIVKQLVNAHGGRVWVESLPGEGAKFYICLPATREYDIPHS